MAISPLPSPVPATYPYLPEVETLIQGNSVGHLYRVTARPAGGPPIVLDVESAGVTFDESWSPYIQADVIARVPEGQASLDALDPRRNCLLELRLGYVYDGVTEDLGDPIVLHLRTREVLRPSNTLKLTATSFEGRAQDRRRMSSDPAPPKTGLNEVIAHAAGQALYPAAVEIVSAFDPGYGASLLTELDLEQGADYQSLVQDVANRTGTWIRCDGDGRWKITPRADVTGTAAHKLTVGPSGTIISADTALQREDYFNAVQLTYTWKDAAGVEQVRYGEAYVPGTGTHGVDAIGWNVYSEDRPGPITKAQADLAAQTVLAYTITRGRGMRLDALAAYWLRPGMTATVQLPAGEQERHLVRAVTFNPGSGSMSVTTRQPETLDPAPTGA